MNHPTDIHVGQRLRQLRILRGLTQMQVADGIGVAFQQEQKYETGRNRIAASRLWDLCRILDTTPGYFFEGLTGGGEAPAKLSGRAIRIARAVDTMNESQREAMARIVEAITSGTLAQVMPRDTAGANAVRGAALPN